MNQAEQDELSLPITTVIVILSLVVMATGFLLTVASDEEIENLERLIALGFLTIAFRQYSWVCVSHSIEFKIYFHLYP